MTEVAAKKTLPELMEELKNECNKILSSEREKALLTIRESPAFRGFVEMSLGNGIKFIDAADFDRRDLVALAQGTVSDLRRWKLQMKVDWSPKEVQREIRAALWEVLASIFGRKRAEFLASECLKKVLTKLDKAELEEAGGIRLFNRFLQETILEQVDLLNPQNIVTRRKNG